LCYIRIDNCKAEENDEPVTIYQSCT